MNFGDRLANLRKLNNLTRKELAEIFSISYSALSNYENNERFPDQEMLINIANYFNVSVDYLLGRTNIKEPIEDIVSEKQQGYSSSKKSIDAEGLSPESQEDLKKYIELLKLKDMKDRNSETADDLTNTD